MKTITTTPDRQGRASELQILRRGSTTSVKGPLTALLASGWLDRSLVPARDSYTLLEDPALVQAHCPGASVIEVIWSGDEVKVFYFARMLPGGNYAELTVIPRRAEGNVVQLPTAATHAVVQRPRRGPLPKCIARFVEFRAEKMRREAERKSLLKQRAEAESALHRLDTQLSAIGA